MLRGLRRPPPSLTHNKHKGFADPRSQPLDKPTRTCEGRGCPPPPPLTHPPTPACMWLETRQARPRSPPPPPLWH